MNPSSEGQPPSLQVPKPELPEVIFNSSPALLAAALPSLNRRPPHPLLGRRPGPAHSHSVLLAILFAAWLNFKLGIAAKD